MSTEEYAVIVSGQRFIFTRDQLEFESSNYFATYFLGDFSEAANGIKEIKVEKEPLLFKLIQAHLRGYKVIPIQDSYVPDYMSKTDALENLRRDADFFGLVRLVTLIDQSKLESVTSEKRIEFATSEKKIYCMSKHDWGKATPNNADGSKRRVALTSDALQSVTSGPHIAHIQAKDLCSECWNVSKGWEVAAWLKEVPPEPTGGLLFYIIPTHYVIESKIV